MYQQNPSTFHFLSARDSAYTWGIWMVIFLLLALSTAVPVSYQWIYTLIALLACAFLLGILYRTRYELRAADLRVFCGFLQKTILYTHIRQASVCTNRHPSYALSAQRVQITYQVQNGKERTLYVSPVDCNGFLILLHAACPHLQGLS